MISLIVVICLLAGTITGKTIEKSCPVCGRCEPREYTESVGFFACRGATGTMFKCWLEDGEKMSDSIKWVPRDTAPGVPNIRPFKGLSILDTLEAHKERKCVDVIDTLLHGKRVTGETKIRRDIYSPHYISFDTTFCECDGDTAYWEKVVFHDTLYGLGALKHIPPVYIRRLERWRKETKTETVWKKLKPKTKTIWE